MAPRRPLILASASQRRADLLQEAGIRFRILIPQVDEYTQGSHPHFSPRNLAIQNSKLKAEAISKKFPNHIVVGADTIVVLGKRIFGKPKDMKDAEKMLGQLNGRTHRVITGVCLCYEGRLKTFSVMTKVTFKKLRSQEIKKYLKLIHPLDKAGAYAAQSHTDRIIQKVEGSFSNVVGLPMERLQVELQRIHNFF